MLNLGTFKLLSKEARDVLRHASKYYTKQCVPWLIMLTSTELNLFLWSWTSQSLWNANMGCEYLCRKYYVPQISLNQTLFLGSTMWEQPRLPNILQEILLWVFVFVMMSVLFSDPMDYFVTPWTLARQASLSMVFPRQEHWSGLPFPFCRGPSQPRNWTCVSCTGRWILYYHWSPTSILGLGNFIKLQEQQCSLGRCSKSFRNMTYFFKTRISLLLKSRANEGCLFTIVKCWL